MAFPDYFVQINGHMATLVAETDFSFILVGGSLLIFFLILLVFTVVLCRHLQTCKLQNDPFIVPRSFIENI